MSPTPLAAALVLLTAGLAQAQPSSCSSDGQPAPAALLERFINADCAACWSDAGTPAAGAGTLALDWVTPGARGEDAPLSVVATRDALQRLQALERKRPLQAEASERRREGAAGALRVAHGLPFNDYIGTSILLEPAGSGPWTAWVALVERLPAGIEGSPVPRNLVRNLLRLDWRLPASGQRPERFSELRAMRIPEGASAQRLAVVGWVEDARGRIGAIAQTGCAPDEAGR